MKNKKIIVAILALIIVAALSMTFTGCTTKFNEEDGFAAMRAAIDNSLTQKTYFAKENIYNHKDESGTGTLEKRLNAHEDDEKTTLNDVKVSYTESFTKALAMESTYYREWTFGPSLSKNIKPKKAVDADYKHYMFVIRDKAMTKKISTFEDFMAMPMVNDYSITKILEELNALTLADILGFSANQAGVIMTYTFTVNKEGHAYQGKPMRIQSMYNKISLIEATTKGATPEFKIDITYKGPKISIISYDDLYNKKEIVDIVE